MGFPQNVIYHLWRYHHTEYEHKWKGRLNFDITKLMTLHGTGKLCIKNWNFMLQGIECDV